MNTKHFLLTSAIAAFGLSACNSKEMNMNRQLVLALPAETPEYNDPLPDHMNSGWSGFSLNNDMVQLGRVLFYDEVLSANDRISCASCHIQQLGWSDGKQKSDGFAFGATKRNSPGFNNTFSKSRFFWDARAESLGEQVLMPIQDHIEMGNISLPDVIERINSKSYYAPLIEAANGENEMTGTLLSTALSSFINAAKTFKSPMDIAFEENDVLSTWDTEKLPQDMREGLELFNDLGCGSCHVGDDFGGWSEANIGLDMNYTDNGMGEWNEDPKMVGVFKIPSLRNVELTAPYMHDGRFATLEEVIEHYNSGIKNHPNLHYLLTDQNDLDITSFLENGGNPELIFNDNVTSPSDLGIPVNPRRLNLTQEQKDLLIKFLKSLSDKSMTTDNRFSNPFVLVEVQ
jgi:cytochrome c peroxidase